MRKKFWLGNMMERDHLDDLSTYGRIILKFILEKKGMMMWTGLIWL